jgi:hypothetical protein
VARTRWSRTALGALVLALALTACSGDEESPAPPSSAPQASPSTADPAGCTVTATTQDEATQALTGAEAGATVCVTGTALSEADLAVATSGAADRPVTLRGEGTTPVRSITVRANHVVVEGFSAVGGDGIALAGNGLVVRGNRVERADLDGISCEEICDDAVVEDNTVVEADGSGILVMGDRVLVQRNSVSGSVRREASDADGIRFFGTEVQIRDNTVFDIKATGYPAGTEPHTDCFQTFDNSRPPTVDAVISGNECRNVDAQCLIATADEAGEEGDVGRSRGILFSGNVCEVQGAQGVLARFFPDVVVEGNTFAGPGMISAAVFRESSSGGSFTGNRVPEGVQPFEVDPSSREGFRS